MNVDETQDRLRELARCVAEPVPPHLAERIRRRIPARLQSHWGKDAVNVFIHLRISRRAALVVILASLATCGALFWNLETPDDSVYARLSDLLPKPGMDLGSIQANFEAMVRRLDERGVEAAYYGDVADFTRPDDIILFYRIDADHYKVHLTNLRAPIEVTGAELIRMQSRMLRRSGRQ